MNWKVKLRHIKAQMGEDFLEESQDMWTVMINNPEEYDWATVSRTQYIPEELLLRILKEDELGDIWGDFDWKAMFNLNQYDPTFIVENIVEPGFLDINETVRVYPDLEEHFEDDPRK